MNPLTQVAQTMANVGVRRSLKTRVTLLTLSVFVIGIWLTAFYASRTMQDDMQRLLGDQQFATVSVVAADINQELDTRLRALKSIAGRITPAMMDHASALQALLQEREVFQQLFNGGSFVTGPDGMSIAAFPFAVERLGVNYAERDFMVAALKGEEVAFGKPVIGRVLGVPTFGMAVPIRNQQGRVIGALVGATNLGLPNFLSHITQSRYGKTGGYVLIAPKHRLVVTATDKTRVMTALPAPGVNPLFDRYLAGFEGSGSVTDSRGLEVLSSAKQIPAAGWLLVARIPTDEALAPIHKMQQQVLLAATLLTLLAGALIWWIVRRQLTPMLIAVKTLAALSKSGQLPQPLPITRQDEVGDLIGGFNRLLEALGKQREAVRQSEERFRSVLENMSEGVQLFDAKGDLIYQNLASLRIHGFEQQANERIEGEVLKATWKAWDETGRPLAPDEWPMSRIFRDGRIQNQVLRVQRVETGHEFWASTNGASVYDATGKLVIAFITITDVTERRRAEEKLRESESRSRAITQSAYEAIITSDRAGNIAGWNRGAEIIFGYTEAQAMGQPMTLLMPERYREAHLAGLNRIRSGAELHLGGKTVELHGLRQDGGEFPLELTIARWESAEGWFVTAIIADISERKHSEAQLIEKLDELRRWQQVTLGREGRVAAVKKEINALLAEHGMPPRYPSVLDEEPQR